jgi:hypothetical protein
MSLTDCPRTANKSRKSASVADYASSCVGIEVKGIVQGTDVNLLCSDSCKEGLANPILDFFSSSDQAKSQGQFAV